MQKNTRNFHIRKKGVFLREMRHLGNNRFAKTVLLLCVLMQAVALMPHHHHGDPTAVCLNYSHINGANPQRLHRHRFAQYATLCVVCVA
mgnify:CR=1 FL=1